MKKLVFASNNPHKLEEIRAILSGQVEVISLAELGCHDDIAETADSLEGNALIKARYIWEHYGCHCFADDTGLEVEALDGAPGVRSARFAGDAASSEDNVSLLLERLSVIALIDGYGTHFCEGTVEGEILTERRGTHGFGYDPVFRPEGSERSFAELSEAEKNALSHRGRAVARLASYLRAQKD